MIKIDNVDLTYCGMNNHILYVYMDITAPLYWWRELAVFPVDNIVNIYISLKERIECKEFELNDFSREYLFTSDCPTYKYITPESDKIYVEDIPALQCLKLTIQALNHYRDLYLKTEDDRYLNQIIQLLPNSYNNMKIVGFSYAELDNIVKRVNRGKFRIKLKEWDEFIKTAEDILKMTK